MTWTGVLAATLLCGGIMTAAHTRIPVNGSQSNATVRTGQLKGQLPARRNAGAQEGSSSRSRVLPTGAGRYRLAPDAPAATSETNPLKIRRTPRSMHASGPRGHLYGNVASFSGIVNIDQAYWGEINPSTGVITPIYRGADLTNPQDYDIQTGAVRDGILYTPVYTEDLIDGVNILWRRRDLTTGDVLQPIRFGANDAAFAYSMTYDPVEDLFHCLSLDSRTTSFGLYTTIDPKTWTVTAYDNLCGKSFLGAISYNPADGQIYAVTDSNELLTIDNYGSGLTTLGYLDDFYTLVENGRTTPMTYSPMDGAFVMSYIDYNDQKMKLVYIDPETLEVTEGAELQPYNPYVTCLWSPDAYAVDEAPEMPASPLVEFDGPALQGKITLRAPALSYAGVEFGEGVEMDVQLTVDGVELYAGKLKAGAREEVVAEFPEGMHTGELVCSLDGQKSPVRTFKFHTGYDNPAAPRGLALDIATLSWEPVTTGAHGGYFEADNVAYDVILNGQSITPEPIAATSILLPADSPMGVADIEVKAVSNGHVSEPASLRAPLGRAISIPWSMAPSREEAALFTTLDANRDGLGFGYTMYESTGEYCFYLFLGVNSTGDDWLFLPATNFPDKSMLYSLAFNYFPTMPYEDLESLEVKIGRRPRPEAMERTIYSHHNLQVWGEQLMTATFPVPETGDWYIGFHCTTDGALGGGVCLNHFSLQSLADRSSSAPADPQVSISAAPKGVEEAIVKITAPTVDLVGNPLGASDEVTFVVKCGGNTAKVSALPGALCQTTIKTGTSGYNDIEIIPSNAAGEGLGRTHTVYVGIDTPLPPTNVKAVPTDDNLGLRLSWDKVSETGVHGGYVDPEKVTYSIVTITGITPNEVATTKDTNYTFVPYNAMLDRYVVGPRAVNEKGASTYSQFGAEVLGRPWPVPVKEYFGDLFNYDPLSYTSTYPFNNTLWSPTRSVLGQGTGARVDCERGALTVSSEVTFPTRGELVLPKAQTKGVEGCVFQLRWLDWLYTPRFSVWGRCAGQEELMEIASFEPTYPTAGEWRDEEVKLPASFNDCGWIEIRIRADLSGNINERGFIDTYQITQNVEYDLKLASISAPASMNVGEKAQALVTVLNAGTEIISGTLTINLADGAGNTISTLSKPITRLVPAAQFLEYIDLEALREYLDNGKIVITATVSSNDDEVKHNDSMSVEVAVASGIAPSVGDLTAAWSDDRSSVVLDWSEPSLTYGGADSFEFTEPFAVSEELGMWRNIDRDGKAPFRIAGLDWPNDRVPIGWQPIDAEALGVMFDERLCPHSGTMYLMARSISVDLDEGEEPIQSDDWLISPEVIGGTQLTFWYGTVTAAYPEFVELWVSETDRNPESFRKQRTFSKSGDEGWEEVRVMLPENVKYFALVYRSFDSLGAMIDDISFTPAHLETWVVDHYSVLRSAAGAEPVEIGRAKDATSFTDPLEGLGGMSETDLAYYVKTAVVTPGGFREGPLSNAARLRYSAVDDIRALEGIHAGRGVITAEGLSGETLSVYTPDGKHLRSATLASDRESINIDAGVYIVKCGNAMGKVIVK